MKYPVAQRNRSGAHTEATVAAIDAQCKDAFSEREWLNPKSDGDAAWLVRGHGEADSGSVTFTSISEAGVSGTFELVFDKETLIGDFVAPRCEGPWPINDYECQ